MQRSLKRAPDVVLYREERNLELFQDATRANLMADVEVEVGLCTTKDHIARSYP